jgi:hypothetical protein
MEMGMKPIRKIPTERAFTFEKLTSVEGICPENDERRKNGFILMAPEFDVTRFYSRAETRQLISFYLQRSRIKSAFRKVEIRHETLPRSPGGLGKGIRFGFNYHLL